MHPVPVVFEAHVAAAVPSPAGFRTKFPKLCWDRKRTNGLKCSSQAWRASVGAAAARLRARGLVAWSA